ncbi:MAG: hypothetical protein JST68_12780 [Bacteroidetes bacterium]|nr:hypothetical protein [Bacteroidota bacterium]
MKIKGIEGLSNQEINAELMAGGKFVVYRYTISLIAVTFRRSSDIYFVRSTEKASMKGMSYTLLTLVFGWWGIPWGPIYTIGSLATNLGGGKDVTHEILNAVNAS